MCPSQVTASVDETLCWHDGPQILTLSGDNKRFLALAVPDPDPARYMFFVTQVDDEELRRLDEGKQDLRSLFIDPASRPRYTFDYAAADGNHVTLTRHDGPPDEAFLPRAGITLPL